MKKIAMFAMLAFVAFTSCKKEEEIDERDKFVGSYQATQTFSVPTLNIYENQTFTQVIRKSTTDENRIHIGTVEDHGPSAKVTGNNYVLDKYSETENIEGTTITIEYTGTGTMNGNIINESGQVLIYLNGFTYSGTWQCTMVK